MPFGFLKTVLHKRYARNKQINIITTYIENCT